jgi:S-DNA-T family DNA segregation ATPase FtsK/SpoIIIE
LSNIIEEMEKRTALLKKLSCANIDEYNEISKTKIQRIIFAFDEVAEVLDKKGLSKEDKDFTSKIESKISKIARLRTSLWYTLDSKHPTT